MYLKKIEILFEMDHGCPSPMLLSDDSRLHLFFNGKLFSEDFKFELVKTDRNNFIGIEFKGYMKYTFGIPSNETIQGHPYYKLGLKSYCAYEVIDSDWIAQLKEIAKIHPYYEANRWTSYRHYIITFHDNMFECISEDFRVYAASTDECDSINNIFKLINRAKIA